MKKFKHLHTFLDRHNKRRTYVRIGGRGKSIAIQADQSDDVGFAREYAAALEKLGGVRAVRGSRPGSWDALYAAYKSWPEWKDLKATTQTNKRSVTERVLEMEINGVRFGELPSEQTTKRDIVKLRDAIDAPTLANAAVSELSTLSKAAITRGLMSHNPAALGELGVKKRKSNRGNNYVWTADDYQRFVKKYPLGTMEYLALVLLWSTGVRASDAYRLGPQHEKNGYLVFTEHKDSDSKYRAAKHREIEILPSLRAAIDASPSGQLAYIVGKMGKPLSGPSYFSRWFRNKAREAGLPPGASPHGVRRAAATGAAEHGASEHAIMALFGWKTTEQANRYTRTVRDKKLAAETISVLEKRREA
jgi:integrase